MMSFLSWHLIGYELPRGFVWPGEVKDEAVENDARPSYDSAPEWRAQGTEIRKTKRKKIGYKECQCAQWHIPHISSR